MLEKIYFRFAEYENYVVFLWMKNLTYYIYQYMDGKSGREFQLQER